MEVSASALNNWPRPRLHVFGFGLGSLASCLTSLVSVSQSMEERVGELAATLRVGAVQLQTEQLRTALAIECGAWKQAYARQLNRHCADVMDELHKYFRVMQRRLDHPLRDLEDIRTYKVRTRARQETQW